MAIGYVQSGSVSKHDNIQVLPVGENGIVRSLQVMDDDVEIAVSGDRVGLAIRNLREEALHRGCMVTHVDSEALVKNISSTFEITKAPFQKRELEIGDVFSWENRFIPDSEVFSYFSASDVMALPYHSASQSGIVQIAYNYNIPVVVTDVGGLPEYVEKGVSGEIVAVNNPDELATCLANGLLNGNFVKMSKNIDDVKSKFTWKNFIDGIESLYSRI